MSAARAGIETPRRKVRAGSSWPEILALILIASQLAVMARVVPPMNWESPAYLRLAESLRAGRGMVELNPRGEWEPNLLRPPGYPAFLALTGASLDGSVLTVQVLQAALYLAALEALRRRVRDLAGTAASRAFLLAAACVPVLGYHAACISSEIPALAILTAAVLLCPVRTGGWLRFAAVGCLIGVGALFRQNLLIAAPMITLVHVARGRTLWTGAWLVSAAAGLMVVPWAERNREVAGVFSPVSGYSGLFRFPYYLDTTFPSDEVSSLYHGDWVGSLAGSGLPEAFRQINRAHGAPDDSPTLMFYLVTSPFPGTKVKQAVCDELNRATFEIYRQLGWARIMATRLAVLPRAWVTLPSSYPERLPLPVAWALSAAQAALVALGFVAASRAVRLRAPALLVVLVVLSAVGVVSQGACVLVSTTVLAYLASRARPPRRAWAAVVAAIVLQQAALMPGRHVEARYTVMVQPMLIALAATELTRRARVIRHSLRSTHGSPLATVQGPA